MIEIRDSKIYPLDECSNGRHLFGGEPTHRGVLPVGSSVPVHKLLTIDLTDDAIPFHSETLTQLPLYYPLKYGSGGSWMQYAIESNDEIRILYTSDPEPDPAGETYVKVDAFPEIRYAAKSPILDRDSIDWFTLTLGGAGWLDHQSDQCENENCKNYHAEQDVSLLASIPPKPIPTHPEIWWEFEGAYMLFYFWLCRGCNTIIASNRST